MAKKKNLESTFFNLVLVLFLVTLISSASLGFVYSITKDRIESAKEATKMRAIQEVVKSGYSNDPGREQFNINTEDQNVLECYPAKEGEDLISVAIKTYSKQAFSGEIWLMVGFLPNGTIHKISVIGQNETPGLGTKITSPKFLAQFEGKNPGDFQLRVKKDGGDVDAITAATISSRAVCDALERAYHAYSNHNKMDTRNE